MHIKDVKIERTPPFTEVVELEFDQNVNVFIGPNASGKSTLLRKIRSKTVEPESFSFSLSNDWPRRRFPSVGTLLAQHNRSLNNNPIGSPNHQDQSVEDLVGNVPWIYIPATRVNLPISDDRAGMHSLEAWYGTLNTVPRTLSEILTEDTYVFDGRVIHQASKFLHEQFRKQHFSETDFLRKQSAKSRAYTCVENICSEVLKQGREPGDYIHNLLAESARFSVTNVHDDMQLFTNDIAGSGMFTGNLSSGTQGTLLWVWYLCMRISEFYSSWIGGTWHEGPGILLIDEIENNLHPTWQRRVIPALVDNFPRLQIFATTHSPFVVAGLKSGQVHMLDRDSDGLVTGITNDEDVVSWTADDILRTLMGVNDPTDKQTAGDAERYRILQDEGKRSDGQAEAERQKEMNDLRERVGRTLLAGGPRAAEDRRFAAELEGILERYKGSQDSNPEDN